MADRLPQPGSDWHPDDDAFDEEAPAGEIAPAVPDGAPKEGKARSRRRTTLEWAVMLIGAVLFALLARTYVVQVFYIPSESMVATLNVDDRVVVNKLVYRFADIERGDVVVFDCPGLYNCPVDDFIKRVVALPGETIRLTDGEVYVDEMLLHEPYVGASPTWGSGIATRMDGCMESVVTDRCTVRDGWVYVLGDNRRFSRDSRWFGPVRKDTVAGRAAFKIWPLSDLGPL